MLKLSLCSVDEYTARRHCSSSSLYGHHNWTGKFLDIDMILKLQRAHNLIQGRVASSLQAIQIHLREGNCDVRVFQEAGLFFN